MDRKIFFDSVRIPLFGGRMSMPQVAGCEALLDAFENYGINNTHHAANILSQVHHETGGYMSPIKETVFANHSNKNPPDSVVIDRLNKAFASGQLSWVKTPYWKDGWFGRGMIQITHKDNYEKLGEALEIDLVGDRDRALELEISAAIAVVGMAAGLFTGKKLSNYSFPAALDAPPDKHPRRIVNGPDGHDDKIAKNHRLFYNALVASSFGVDLTPPTPVPTPPTRTRSVILAEIEKLVEELRAME
jgi:predicted chitinase